MIPEPEVVEWARRLLKVRQAECDSLDRVAMYWRGKQPLPVVPRGTPSEIRRMAEMSRVNVLPLVVDVPAQSLYVVGYRQEGEGRDDPAWDIWQANKMDAHQTGIHRAALAYGTSYTLVLPGEPNPVIRGLSPRRLTTLYGDDQEWPEAALEVRDSEAGGRTYRLYDDMTVWFLEEDEAGRKPGEKFNPVLVEEKTHGAGVCPVIRFRNHDDLDDVVCGEVEPLIPLQDQIDFTTFDLMVAQHFTAFRQRYIMGWLAPTEVEKVKASASRLMTFEDPDVKVGEFGQTDLSGYLESRESTLQHLAIISQTPPHYLLGKLVNLSAEALAAAEAGQRRKIAEREVLFGESWEQTIGLAARLEGLEVTEGAQVRWRDTEARALASTVDALGKMAQMLNIPPVVLWEKIPGWTQQDVERARAEAANADPIGDLTAVLDRQMGGDSGEDEARAIKAKADALGALIRAGVKPEAAARQVGITDLEFFEGLLPITLKPESAL